MNLFFKSSNAVDEPQSNGTTVVTASSYFGLGGEIPYEKPDKFLSYGESLRQKEAFDLSACLNAIRNSQKMDGNPATGIDAGSRAYTFHRFYKARAVMGFKIINGGGFPQLIQDYQDGKITINFTLNDLIAEARKA